MQAQSVRGLFLIGMLFAFFSGCVMEPARRPKKPPCKPVQEIPARETPIREPLDYVPAPMKAWPIHPVTAQSRRSRAVREKRTPALVSEFSRACLTLGSPIFIRIFKESKELELWVQRGKEFVLFKTYSIFEFSGTLGPKVREGDRQAPEGFYSVTPARMNPNSRFHLAFNIGYPNRYDKEHRRTGGLIMIHGNYLSRGCFAMTDPRIEEIYTIADYALNAGQPFFRVHIFPFRMTEENMRRYAGSPHIEFWENLREGYAFFEKTRRPPWDLSWNRKYVFLMYHQADTQYP